jgi:hypothetical protein
MPITLRAHHIGSVKALFKSPRELIVFWLIKGDYIKSEKDPFVNSVYNLKSLFKSPQTFKIKIGGLDLICEACPRHKIGKCNPNEPKNEIVGKVFLGGSYEGPLRDIEIVNKYDLSTEREYTTEELRKIAGF